MNARTLIVVVLALVCGLSAVFLVKALRSQATAPTIERTGVVFATANLQTGEMVSEAGVEVRQMPVEDIPDDALRTVSDAIDRAALATIDKGDMLRQIKLAEKGAGRGMAARITPGMRAVVIQTPSFSASLGGFLLPDNRVDINLTTLPGNNGSEAPRTLLEDVKVLAVDKNANQPAANKLNPEETRFVTVEVTPEGALKLDYGQSLGTLTLKLRNPADKSRNPAGVVTLAELQGIKPNVAKANEPQPLDQLIAPGKQAFTINETSFSAALASHIAINSRVDVLFTFDTAKGDDQRAETSKAGASRSVAIRPDGQDLFDQVNKIRTGGASTRTLVKNLKVLLVEPKNDGSNPLNPGIAADSRYVTLEVDPAEARKLDLGQQMGKLHLSLRSAFQPFPGQIGQDPHPNGAPGDMLSLEDRTLFHELEMVPPGEKVLATYQIRTLRGTRVGQDNLTVYEAAPRAKPPLIRAPQPPPPPKRAFPRVFANLGADESP